MPNPFASMFGGGPSPSDEDEQRQERSWAELKAGRLPLSAQERLATQAEQGVFTSALSARDLVGVRAAGYEPVGQAFGTATFRLTRMTYAAAQIHPNGFLGSNRGASLRTNPVMIGAYHDGERQARTKAVARMTAECTALSGDGVVGVTIRRTAPQGDLYEFTLIGTVVRRARRSSMPPTEAKSPFITTMSAADVGRLAAAGWRPVTLLYELQRFAGHAGYVGFGGGILNPGNYQGGEIVSATAVLGYGRSRVRQLLNRRLSPHSGMILDALTGDVEHRECSAIDGQSDFVVDVEAIGTEIEPIPSYRIRSARAPLDIMPVLRLDDGLDRT